MKQKIKQAIDCGRCRDKKYVFVNIKGRVQAETCSCFECKLCEGSRRIFEEAPEGFSKIKECECNRLFERMALFNHAGVPGKFVHEDFSSYSVDPPQHRTQKNALLNSKKFIKDYVDRKGQYSQGLIYMGAPGLGKTHIVVSVIKELVMQHGIECKFVDFFELLRDIRHGYGEDISEKDFIDPYVGVKVLVIDELAKGRNTDWEITILDHFISTRYNDDDKVTLVTTNFSDNLENPLTPTGRNDKQGLSNAYSRFTLEEKIGARIHSRLMEMCKKINLEGKDYRR
jgi:DNA replication protein DnaC|tara:strand:+ start:137 stop:991 length:855 start_codon:yes stop_codon:yes gene_type:complete